MDAISWFKLCQTSVITDRNRKNQMRGNGGKSPQKCRFLTEKINIPKILDRSEAHGDHYRIHNAIKRLVEKTPYKRPKNQGEPFEYFLHGGNRAKGHQESQRRIALDFSDHGDKMLFELNGWQSDSRPQPKAHCQRPERFTLVFVGPVNCPADQQARQTGKGEEIGRQDVIYGGGFTILDWQKS